MAERKRESISKASLMSDKVVISNGFFFPFLHTRKHRELLFLHAWLRATIVCFFFFLYVFPQNCAFLTTLIGVS